MTLWERVTMLIKADVNALIEKAENPETVLKQLLLDMQNQYIQVKTHVAIAAAHQHLLERKQKENLEAQNEWLSKAELALRKGDEKLARLALERSLTYETAAKNFSQQMHGQAHQLLSLRDSLRRLEQKMTETKAEAELLLAQHRRARLAAQSGVSGIAELKQDAAFERLSSKVAESEALAEGQLAVGDRNAEQKLAELELEDRVNQLLAELKAKAGQLPQG